MTPVIEWIRENLPSGLLLAALAGVCAIGGLLYLRAIRNSERDSFEERGWNDDR